MKPNIFDQKIRKKLSELEDLPKSQAEVEKIMFAIKPHNRSYRPSLAVSLIALFALIIFGNLILQKLMFTKTTPTDNKSNPTTNQSIDHQGASTYPNQTVNQLSKPLSQNHLLTEKSIEANQSENRLFSIKSQDESQRSLPQVSPDHEASDKLHQALPIKRSSPSIDQATSTITTNATKIYQNTNYQISDLRASDDASDFLMQPLTFRKIVSPTSVQNINNLLTSVRITNITPSYDKFRIGLMFEAGHMHKNIGIVGEYFFKPRWSIMTGIGLGIRHPIRYSDHQDFEDETGEELNEHYPTFSDPDRKASDIKVLKKEIKIPLLLQFYRPLTRSISIFATAGTSIKWLDNHNVTYTKPINGTDQEQNFQTNFYTFSMDVTGGLGLGKKFGRFSTQVSGVARLQPENKSMDHHENHIFHFRASVLYHLK